ncbi:MarR family winged helix-turn-helix transcriptional regulator [Kineococcus glutinatus]|uniref:HTH marR-type domain-containing protein n=1 Tax=Kineococcus glutinatus TaxID=1070872 RepID=A0ABP9I4F5_9ACTN
MAGDDGAVLGDLLMRNARTIRRRWRDLLSPWELSPHQARALRAACEAEGMRVSDLAGRLHIAPRSATEVARDLESRGLVARTPDPRDGRAVLLVATAEGRRVRELVDAARAADLRAHFRCLPERDRTELARILHRLAEQG